MDNPSQSLSPEPIARPERRQKPRSPQIIPTALITAVIVATVFVAFSPNTFSGGFGDRVAVLLTTEPEAISIAGTVRPVVKVGIVAGHLGNDSGAVCENGTTEGEVNLKIANIVQQQLSAQGIETDLLKEKDPRLNGYRAAALVSIHNDSCDFVNDQATGYKVAAAMSSHDIHLANRLEVCLRDRYQARTHMNLHESVTNDMTFYHAFNEIDPRTPAAIIETGFLNLDYDILTKNTDVVAQGVTEGIICFIDNENIAPTATP